MSSAFRTFTFCSFSSTFERGIINVITTADVPRSEASVIVALLLTHLVSDSCYKDLTALVYYMQTAQAVFSADSSTTTALADRVAPLLLLFPIFCSSANRLCSRSNASSCASIPAAISLNVQNPVFWQRAHTLFSILELANALSSDELHIAPAHWRTLSVNPWHGFPMSSLSCWNFIIQLGSLIIHSSLTFCSFSATFVCGINVNTTADVPRSEAPKYLNNNMMTRSINANWTSVNGEMCPLPTLCVCVCVYWSNIRHSSCVTVILLLVPHRIQTHKRFKRTLFIRIKHSIAIFRSNPLYQDTKRHLNNN